MRNLLSKYRKLFKAICIILCIHALSAQQVQAFDGLIDFENYSQGYTGRDYFTQFFTESRIKQCFANLVGYNELGNLYNNFLPPVIMEEMVSPPPPALIKNLLITSGGALSAVALSSVIMPLAGATVAVILAAAQTLQMMDVCVNTYPLQPHEFYNREVLNLSCSNPENAPNISFIQSGEMNPIGAQDLPYYFNCDKNYDPNIDAFKVDGVNYGIGWGYNKKLCASAVGSNANKLQHLVGKIRIEIFPGLNRLYYNVQDCGGISGFFKCAKNAITLDNSKYTPCTMNKRSFVELYPGEIKQLPGTAVHVYAYLKFDKSKNLFSYPNNNANERQLPQIQLCAIGYVGAANIPSMWPVKIGCTPVVPAKDLSIIPNNLLGFIENTRCTYLRTGRVDLQSLGNDLSSAGTSGSNTIAISKFLQSDFHVFSTSIGCIKDILNKYVMRPLNNQSQEIRAASFFELVQESMRGIVFALLTLALTLFAIKSISSAQPLKQSDYLMWLLKFALVVSFSVGSMWYSTQSDQPTIFSAIINASDEIGKFFLNFPQINDPIGACHYTHAGSEILTDRVITSAPKGVNQLLPTIGFSGVKMTIWDYIDCKIINYFNLGTCNYGATDLFLGFIKGLFANIFWGGGIILLVAYFIFSFMLLLLVIRFAFVVIISMIVITVLVLLSPLFICLALFEQTKGIFKGWFDMIIGYMLYPGLIFAFMALMLASFDAAFYGDIKGIEQTQDVVTFCKEKNSMYCMTAIMYKTGGCLDDAAAKQISDAFMDTIHIIILGDFPVLKKSVVLNYKEAMINLAFFALLFWLLHNAILSFLAALLNIPEIGTGAMNNLSFSNLSFISWAAKRMRG